MLRNPEEDRIAFDQGYRYVSVSGGRVVYVTTLKEALQHKGQTFKLSEMQWNPAPQASALSALESVQKNDTLRVYHGTTYEGFAALANGIDATVPYPRRYGGSPVVGLFVTNDFDVAERFAGRREVIMTLDVLAHLLYGTDYDANIRLDDDRYWRSKYPQSFRPSLTESLLGVGSEPQAVLLGRVPPQDIVEVCVDGEDMSRQQAIAVVGGKLRARNSSQWLLDLGFNTADPQLQLAAFVKGTAKAGRHSESHVLQGLASLLRRWGVQGLVEGLANGEAFGFAICEDAAKGLVQQLHG